MLIKSFEPTDTHAALRQREEDAARQKRLYEAILSNTPDLAYVWDLNHRFTYVNEGLLRMWGKTWDEAIGKNCLELGYEPWHAAMHDREIEQVVATKLPVRGEVPFKGTFGRRIYDYILVPVFGADGEVEAVAGTTRDVTERKQAEQANRESQARLAQIFDMAPAYMAVLRGPDCVIEQVNAAYIELVGERGREFVGKKLLDAMPELANQPFIEILRQVMETGEPFTGSAVRVPLRRGDGTALEERILDFVYQPLLEADGKVMGVLVHGVDLTDRLRAEEGLRKANLELERFSSIASHDLKEPLRGIASLASFIGEDDPALAPLSRTRLSRIQEMCTRLGTMVEGLLDYARLGGVRSKQDCNLQEVVGRALDKLGDGLRGKNVEVVLETALPTVEGDPVLLERVFANLIVNAVKYNDSPCKLVRIGYENGDVSGVYVRDNGVGIDPRHHEKVFELFRRAPDAAERDRSGIGLGLALVRNIMAAHGGAVSLKSAPGNGSTFVLQFPAVTTPGVRGFKPVVLLRG